MNTLSTPSPALAAFLRGIEPRALVLARAQAGPSLEAEPLLASVREDFTARAARLPLADWPLRYWGLLLARDELACPSGATPSHPLYRLAHTRRLALLLRLVVGLEPSGAARVLGLSETAYLALCTDAEDKLAVLGVGPAVLMRWQEGFQAEARAGSVGPGRGAGAVAAAAPSAAPRAARPAWRLPPLAIRWRPLQWGLSAVALALLAVLGATFVWPPGGRETPPSANAPAGTASATTLPEAAPAQNPRDVAADLVVDPDFALLVAPADEPWREGVGFLAWWSSAQGDPLPAPPPPAAALPTPEWAALSPELRAGLAPVEGAWPSLDGLSRRALLAQAEVWAGLDAPARAALRSAYDTWLARPALERSRLRAAFAAWQALDDGERALLRQVGRAFAALPAPEQTRHREAYAALSADEQAGWAEGPRLGRQLPGLRPLLQALPAAEQAELIAAIEGLDAAQREALATRLAGMGQAQRAALRGRVLAAPVDQRTGLLAAP